MNLILLRAEEISDVSQVQLQGRRAAHLISVLKVGVGSELTVGVLNGGIGKGQVLTINSSTVVLAIHINRLSPAPLPLTLLLALPRPKVLKRVFSMVASLGVETLILLNSYKVEKSYWSSPALAPDTVNKYFCLGLEQAKTCQLPALIMAKRFKPFVEDQLPALAADKQKWVAHPYLNTESSTGSVTMEANRPSVLAIGPEGGFIDYEIEKLQSLGFNCFSSGPRILKVETAIPVMISRLYSEL